MKYLWSMNGKLAATKFSIPCDEKHSLSDGELGDIQILVFIELTFTPSTVSEVGALFVLCLFQQ